MSNTIKGTWTRINGPKLPRSSHSVSVIGDTLYIFGGEIQPRQPVSNALHAISLVDGSYEEIAASGEAPEARVGHTAGVFGGEIWVFGGRDGPNPAPLEERGALHVFSPKTRSWRRVTPTPDSHSSAGAKSYPVGRSYHCCTPSSRGIIIHSGCGDDATGRLNDVWEFVAGTGKWEQLGEGDAPGEKRGGSAVAWRTTNADADGGDGGELWRFGGYNGKSEVGGVIDHLPVAEAGAESAAAHWKSHQFNADITSETVTQASKTSGADENRGPPARSVTALHALPSGKLITLFGEGKPSNLGHEGAGNFWGDVWVYDPKQQVWTEVEQRVANGTNAGPEARGWFGSDVWDGGVVIWGGLAGSNERLGDGWVLRLEE